MAAPTYAAEFSIGLLGTISNLLSTPMNFYRCSLCAAVIAEGQTGTTGRDLHTSFHTGLDTAASNASAAVSAANTAKTTAGAAQDMANRAMTSASDTASALHQIDTVAQSAVDIAQAALPSAEVTLCPLCRVAVKTELLRTHLTYHYRRAHGDPVEFPEDFDPTTADLSEVDPPMVTGMSAQ